MKIKKLLALVLSIVMLFSLAACGSGGDNGDDGEQEPQTVETALKYIKQGKHQAAYDMLKKIDDERANELLKDFVALPAKAVRTKGDTVEEIVVVKIEDGKTVLIEPADENTIYGAAVKSRALTYDKNGHIVRADMVEIYRGEESSFYYEYEYNELGLVSKRKQCAADGTFVESKSYVYSDGTLTEIVTTNANGTNLYSRPETNDYSDILANAPKQWSTDENGNKIYTTTVDGRDRTYTEDGRILEYNAHSAGNVVYQYNDQKLLVYVNQSSSQGGNTYEMKYDANGNLIYISCGEERDSYPLVYEYSDYGMYYIPNEEFRKQMKDSVMMNFIPHE